MYHIEKLPRLYLINGTSSSGKTTLSKALIEKLDNKYIYLSLDNHIKSIFDLYEINYKNFFLDDRVFPVVIPNIVLTFHDIIKSYLMCNTNIVVDHVLQEKKWKNDLFKKIDKYKTCKIGLHCSKEELEKREKERGDRQIGSAISQFRKVHKNINYDIEIDTQKYGVTECVDLILKYNMV